MKYSELSKPMQDMLAERFGRYGISGEYMYDNTSFFSSDMKELSDEEFLQIFDNSNISLTRFNRIFPDSMILSTNSTSCSVYLS